MRTIDRRRFLQRSFISGAISAMTLAAAPTMPASVRSRTGGPSGARRFKMKYAPHFGMFKESAGPDLIDQLKFMANQGFTAFEDNPLMSRPQEVQQRIGDTLTQLGMTMGVFVIDKGGNSANSLAAGKAEYVD